MSEDAKDTGPVLSEVDDDLPDFSGDEWAVKIDALSVKQATFEGIDTGGANGDSSGLRRY